MGREHTEKAVRLRVKHEPPTLEEAMFAAAGMAGDLDQQVEIAAALMGLSLEPATVDALKAARPRFARNTHTLDSTNTRGRPGRAVVVERKRGARQAVRSPAPTQIARFRVDNP